MNNSQEVKVVVGLDLSLTRSGIAIIPSDWGGDTSRVIVTSIRSNKITEMTDLARAERLLWMATKVRGSAFCESIKQWGNPTVLGWFIESLPSHGAFGLVKLGELHGVMRTQLISQNLVTAPQSAGRRLLMGKLPKRDLKTMVSNTVRSFPGASGWNGDEVDAFVTANWGAAELGLPFVHAEAVEKV